MYSEYWQIYCINNSYVCECVVDNPNCAVAVYEEYKKRRPINTPESPFYLSPKTKPCGETQHIWYSTAARGVNPIGQIASEMSKAADIHHHTNHSASHVRELVEAGVQDLDIIALTGHRCVSGLKPYKEPTQAIKRAMQETLGTFTSPKQHCPADLSMVQVNEPILIAPKPMCAPHTATSGSNTLDGFTLGSFAAPKQHCPAKLARAQVKGTCCLGVLSP